MVSIMKQYKPLASLSLDLDNKWSYMKTHGDPGWEGFPSYLDKLTPRVLNFLASRQLKITVFVVGQDAALERNHEALKSIAAAGHEIGNHSFSHEPWMHHFPEASIDEEISRTADSVEWITGKRPIGFRGPGFSNSPAMMQVLASRGYLYDASTLPTFLGPLARAYYFKTTTLNKKAAQERKELFGSFSDVFRPIKAHCWGKEKNIVEIPVTTMPLLRTPIHASYILYLSQLSKTLAFGYFRAALELCRLTGTSPSLLLHPLDFLGSDDAIGLSYFPGMQIESGRKMEMLEKILDLYCQMFSVVSLQEHAYLVARQTGAFLVSPAPEKIQEPPHSTSVAMAAQEVDR